MNKYSYVIDRWFFKRQLNFNRGDEIWDNCKLKCSDMSWVIEAVEVNLLKNANLFPLEGRKSLRIQFTSAPLLPNSSVKCMEALIAQCWRNYILNYTFEQYIILLCTLIFKSYLNHWNIFFFIRFNFLFIFWKKKLFVIFCLFVNSIQKSFLTFFSVDVL